MDLLAKRAAISHYYYCYHHFPNDYTFTIETITILFEKRTYICGDVDAGRTLLSAGARKYQLHLHRINGIARGVDSIGVNDQFRNSISMEEFFSTYSKKVIDIHTNRFLDPWIYILAQQQNNLASLVRLFSGNCLSVLRRQ